MHGVLGKSNWEVEQPQPQPQQPPQQPPQVGFNTPPLQAEVAI